MFCPGFVIKIPVILHVGTLHHLQCPADAMECYRILISDPLDY